MKKTTTFLLSLVLLMSVGSFAQTKPAKNNVKVRCATTEYENRLKAAHPKRLNTEEFEAWLAPKVDAVKQQMRLNTQNAALSPAIVYTIPVVVHVVHNGVAVGTGSNITDAQVISQITVLNQDFRRMLGTPGYNTNPVGADTEIQFCLAQRDPSGNESTGIDRVVRSNTSWTSSQIDSNLKPQTQWDPTKYLNIWVVTTINEPGFGELLGYAQFPSNSGLGGLETSGGVASTDGVVIGYPYFGSTAIYPAGSYEAPYDRGRTTTHEVGHFFGLRHIWGDSGSCTVNATDSFKDYCPDTPAAAYETIGCPSSQNSCTSAPGNDMTENYMDYTNDLCLNVFTANQKARMIAVMQNSPRRSSLATSDGCLPVAAFGLDATVNIVALVTESCSTTFTPTISIENKGSDFLTSATITYNVDNGSNQTYNWTGFLSLGESDEIVLSPIASSSGTHTFYAAVTSANETTDENSANDTKSQLLTLDPQFSTTSVILTLQRDEYGSETTWNFKNSSGTVIASGGPYANNTTGPLPAAQTFTVAIPANGCYTFTINDTEGDGICCDYGQGSYSLKTAENTIFATGGSFGTSETKTFNIAALGIDDFTTLDALYLYPNPTRSILNIAVPNEIGLPNSYAVYNNLGQIIHTVDVKSTSDLTLDTSRWSSGIYFIKVNKDAVSKTLQFIKN